MNKRTVLILLILFVFIAPALAACGGDKSDDVAQRPVIQLKVGDKTYAENIYSYCWPESKDNLACNVDETALVQPINKAPVTKGDNVRFVIDSKVGTPKKFSATLLGGFNDVQDLGTGNEGVYNVQLEDDLYRVQVDAEYENIEGKPAYISYVFGLQVAGVIVATPTPLPTDTPVPSPTATETPVPTATPTPEPTNTRAPTATPVPTQATPSTLLPAGATPTVTPVPAGDLGEIMITGTVQLSSAGTTVAVAGAQVSYSHTSIMYPERASSGTASTDANGQFTLGPIMVHDTDNVTVSAEAPGYQPQTIQRSGIDTWSSGGVFNFVLAASPVPTPIQSEATLTPVPAVPATAVPTAIPTVVVPPTPVTPQPTSSAVPPLALEVGGKEYLPVGYQFCQRSASGERVCIELPVTAAPTDRISLLRGSAAQIRIGGQRPVEVEIAYLSDTGEPTGQPETRSGDNILLLTVTPEPGSYILSIHVTWAVEDATYYFRVTVSD